MRELWGKRKKKIAKLGAQRFSAGAGLFGELEGQRKNRLMTGPEQRVYDLVLDLERRDLRLAVEWVAQVKREAASAISPSTGEGSSTFTLTQVAFGT